MRTYFLLYIMFISFLFYLCVSLICIRVIRNEVSAHVAFRYMALLVIRKRIFLNITRKSMSALSWNLVTLPHTEPADLDGSHVMKGDLLHKGQQIVWVQIVSFGCRSKLQGDRQLGVAARVCGRIFSSADAERCL